MGAADDDAEEEGEEAAAEEEEEEELLCRCCVAPLCDCINCINTEVPAVPSGIPRESAKSEASTLRSPSSSAVISDKKTDLVECRSKHSKKSWTRAMAARPSSVFWSRFNF